MWLENFLCSNDISMNHLQVTVNPLNIRTVQIAKSYSLCSNMNLLQFTVNPLNVRTSSNS